MLPKSQIDDETIEEAIDRLIAVQESDEEAHLGVGDSLQSHKASEIIDHLARSVYRDKIIWDRFTIDESFSTIDAWQNTAGAQLTQLGEVTIQTSAVTNNTQYLMATPGDSQPDAASVEQNPTWETRVMFGQITDQNVWVCQGDPTSPGGFGFKVENATMYAWWYDNESAEHKEEIKTIVANQFYILRCEVVFGENVKWYVDDVLLHTEADPDIANTMVFMMYMVKTLTTAARWIFVQVLHWDADYSN